METETTNTINGAILDVACRRHVSALEDYEDVFGLEPPHRVSGSLEEFGTRAAETRAMVVTAAKRL